MGPTGEKEVERRQRESAERRPILDLTYQTELEPEGDQRDAEHQRSVHVVPEPRRFAAREEQRDRHVQQEEEHQERLGTREEIRFVESRPHSVPMANVNAKPTRLSRRHALNHATATMPAFRTA